MIVSVASGKGGTGKTTVAVNLALSLEDAQLIDCDVEEPNCNLFLGFELEKVEDVKVKIPVIDEKKCTHCGKCAKLCEYNAIAVLPDTVMVFPALCHGCGLCAIACPEGAITEGEKKIGVVERGKNKLDFLQGTLDVGEARSTPLIKRLKELADRKKTTVLDVPPGAACPVIEALSETDYCILVTEPTPFGLYDLEIAVDLCRKLGLRFGVVINRDGIGDGKVEGYCREEGIKVLLKIPFDRRIAELYSEGKPFTSEMPEWKKRFKELFGGIR